MLTQEVLDEIKAGYNFHFNRCDNEVCEENERGTCMLYMHVADCCFEEIKKKID